MTFTTSGGGPFSYIAWLPQDYSMSQPCYGARLVIDYGQRYNDYRHHVGWVGDRQTWSGPEHLLDTFWTKAQPLVQEAYKLINLPENARMVETQLPQDRAFKTIVDRSSDLGIAVYYCCAHGYCYFVAIEEN